MIPQTIILNTAAGEQNVQLFCKPGEMSYAFRFKIANSSGFMDLSSYEKILLGIDVGKRFSTQIGTLIDDDTIEVSITADSLSSPGNFPCCLILVNGITELHIGGISLQCGIGQLLEEHPASGGLENPQSYDNEIDKSTSFMYQKKVGFFGDSLTWGQTDNISTKSSNPYPKMFCDYYKCIMYNFGVQGATGSQSSSRTFDHQITANQEAIKNLDYAFVMFGTNDFSQGIEPGVMSKTRSTFQSSADSFGYGLAKGLDRIYSLNNDIIITLIIPPYVKGVYNKAYWSNRIGLQRESYDAIIKNLGKIFNIKVLDLSRNCLGVNEADYYVDLTHFNDAGYRILGQMLIQQFMGISQKHEYDYYEDTLLASCNALPTNLFDSTAFCTAHSFYNGTYYKLSANTPVTSRSFYLISCKAYFHFKCYCSASDGITINATINDTAGHSFAIQRKLSGTYNDVTFA